MKPVKPRPAASVPARKSASKRAPRKPDTLDFIQGRIEAYSKAHGGGVEIRKDAHGYSLHASSPY